MLSVVIPTCGDGRFLDEQLEALAGQRADLEFEVVLVANHSTVDLDELATSWSGRLDLVVERADGRAGAAYARNRGIERARGDVLLFVDDDDVVAPGYVAAMRRALEYAPAVGARVDVTTLNPGWRQHVRPASQTEGLAHTHGVPTAGGGSLGIRRSVLDEVGPFDEALDGFAGEDLEWCLRLASRGYELTFVADALLHYRFRTAVRALWRQAVRYGRGGEMVMPEWAGWGRWVRSLAGPVRLMVLGRGRGERRRGVFLLGRRVGRALAHRHRCRVGYMRNTP
ncbi:MAG: hypothetical protein RL219_1618 [Actinomycetota bacterium]|jgi:GT2 family glycosyltransferase